MSTNKHRPHVTAVRPPPEPKAVAAQAPTQAPPFIALLDETRPTVSTAAAAYYLSRQPQTMRAWASRGGPVTPLRVGGRLAWPMSAIKRLLGVG